MINTLIMMNKSNKHKCPICNEQNNIYDEFCENCSWELIDIPKGSSNALLSYFNKKVKKHKQLFEKKQNDSNTIIKLNDENSNYLEKIDSLNTQLSSISKENTNLKQIVENKKNLEDELNSYTRRYGENWVSNKTQTDKEFIIVNWVLEGNVLRLSSQVKNFQKSMHKQLAILFKQRSFPDFGSFDIAILSDYELDNNDITVSIDINMIPKGSYFIKPISLISKKKNILFFHKDQSLNPTNFNWDKTKINIK